MKLINKLRLNILFIFFISFLFCFAGCQLKAEQKSLVDLFSNIDNIIKQGDLGSAESELKKIEKHAKDKSSCLGIYKRYIQLGDIVSAEKVLSKGLKYNSDSDELAAVYTKFLIDNDRLDEAEKAGSQLIGTKYSSLYSEVVLKKSLNISFAENTKDFYDIYYSAYLGSKNPVWIKNCAILDLKFGNYDRIAELAPASFADVDDAFFWALALYDAGRYYEAINILEKAKEIRENYNSKENDNFKTSFIEQVALLSDAYMSVSDIDSAEKVRMELILKLDNINEDISETDNNLLPIIMTNSAIWAYNQGENDRCADFLFYIVNKWPDCVPALILYSDFAYNSNLNRKESLEVLALREAGLSTIEMEKYDNRRKIPVSDAKYRVESSLKRTDNPYLSIVQLDLKYKTDKSLSVKDKNRDLWKLLEDSFETSKEYKSLLIQYALNSLLSTKQYDDAWSIFQNYVFSISDFSSDDDFWTAFINNVNSYDLSIVEFGAWFAAYEQLGKEALNLYEYCVYGEDKHSDNFISINAPTSACMNLANIYESTGSIDKALDLYSRISGRESKKSLRSEIFYRIASIYVSVGDIKNALRSVEYAYELYPENIRASLLKDSLKNRED